MLKYMIFIGIFCTAAADLKISKHNGRDKSVNLALETVLEFDQENKETDINILNKVNKFIGKIKNVIENRNISRRNLKRGNKNIFTDFIVNLIQTLIKYEDNDLEYFVLTINSELKRHRGSIFHELAENIDFQKVFADKFDKINNNQAETIRHYLKAFANNLNEEKYVKKEELLDTINSMYKEDSVSKFNQFIEDMEDYRLKARKNIDLQQLIRGGLKSILFDPYSSLQVHSRSILTSKLREYLKYYYDLLNDDPKYTTNIQNVSELRTRSENYMDKILNLSTLKQYYAKWVRDIQNRKSTTTQMTNRPHSVPTTRKTEIEITEEDDNDGDADGDHNVKLKKKHKPSIDVRHKIIFEKDMTKYKEGEDKTSEEGITLRQMYVEKHLDLKYDPYAYDHLTTDMKKNEGIVDPPTSPTTSKPYKKSLLERSLKLKQIEKHDSDTFDETKQKFYDIDTDSADLSQFTSKRQISVKYTENPEHFEARSEYKIRSENGDSSEDQELYTFEPRLPNVIELVKDIGYSIEIKKDLDLSDENPNVKNARSKNERYRKESSRTFGDHLKPVNIKSLRQNRDSLKPKLKIFKHPLKYRHFNSQHFGRQQYRRHNTAVPIITQKGLLIEEFGDTNHKRYHRRINHPDITVNYHSKLLGRIQHLEKELKIVKSHIKNDTNVKDLVSQVENGIEPKTVDVDIVVKARNIKNDDFSSKGPNIYEKPITDQSPNLNREVQVMESNNDVNRFISESNIDKLKTTNFLNQVSTLESNNANQGKMYFPKSELKEVSQLDKENKEPNDTNSWNTKSNNHIYDNSTEYNIKRVITDSKQKDNVFVKSLKEKNITSEDRLDKNWDKEVFKGRYVNKRNDYTHPKTNNLNSKDVKTELQPTVTKEMEQDRKAHNSGLTFRGRYDETTSIPKAKVELKTNDKIIQTQGTASNLLDSTTTPSKLIKELTQEIGEQLAGLSDANVERNAHNGETDKNREAMDLHLVLKSGSTPSINNETLTRWKSSSNITLP
ncbi:unnamed protein product [Arctia plantaginis]|uniref:Uncharacterized protein n=1 Tax=Arctia plantaginis TaxID=874455 RepID=A0A8S1B8J0_ARCPL|nr:unnamed protein product [Arctia plantaginis]